MNKRTVLTYVTLVIMCVVMLTACGSETAGIVAKKAVESYVGLYLKDVPDEATRQQLMERKEDIAAKALHNYLNNTELDGLGQADKVKQAVMLAIDTITNEPAAG